jgi:hypothetical protein
VCVEHDEGGFAWRKAMRWWEDHVGCRLPTSVDDAIELLNDGHMMPVVAIEVEKEGKWDRVIAIHHGERRDPGDDGEGGTGNDPSSSMATSCKECGMPSLAENQPVLRKIDVQGRALFYRQCPYCTGNHGGIGKWLPHTPEIEAVAVDETTTEQDDLPW